MKSYLAAVIGMLAAVGLIWLAADGRWLRPRTAGTATPAASELPPPIVPSRPAEDARIDSLSKPAAAHVLPLAEIRWADRWYPAQVLAERENKVQVHLLGDDPRLTIWVQRDDLRLVAADDDVSSRDWRGEAYRDGSWRPVQILKQNQGRYYVRYLLESRRWDEWLAPDRLRFVRQPAPQS